MPDKNIIAAVITPDKKDWHPVEQPPPFQRRQRRRTAAFAALAVRNACSGHREAGVGELIAMTRRMRKIGQVAESAIEDVWQRRATAAAIAAARGVVKHDGPIPPGTPIGRLSDIEWGWIVAAILFGWISTRAEQAAAEQLDTEHTIRMTGLDPRSWDAGAVAAILPELAEPARHRLVEAARRVATRDHGRVPAAAMRLIRKAMIARDLSANGINQKIQRQHDRAPSQRRRRRAADDARRIGRAHWTLDHATQPQPRQPVIRDRQRRRSTTRSNARPRHRPSSRGPISAPASSATNACAKFNTIGGASPRCQHACAKSSNAGIISRTSRAST